jgi:multidrug efflux pump
MRYNGFLSADINAGAAPGFSSGQAQEAVERIAKETLPKGFAFEWTELTYQEILAGNSAVIVFPLGDAAGLPGAGRAVREPDPADRDPADRADGPAGRLTGVWLSGETTTCSPRSA